MTQCWYFSADGTVAATATLLVATTPEGFAGTCGDPDGVGEPVDAWFDPEVAQITTFVYDELGRVVARRDPAQQPSGPQTVLEYWADGKLRRETDPAGYSVEFVYGPDGELLARTDQVGATTVTATNRIRPGDPDVGECPPGLQSTGCRVVTTTVPVDAATVATTVAVFDASGDLVEARDAAGGVTRYRYGPLGRLEQVTDPVGLVTTSVYDVDGRVVASVAGDDPGDATADTVTIFDKLGRVVSRVGPDLGGVEVVESFSYDKAGRVVMSVTAGGSADRVERHMRYGSTGLVQASWTVRSEAPHPVGTRATVERFYTPGGRQWCVKTRVSAAAVGVAERYTYAVTEFDVAGRPVRSRVPVTSLDAGVGGCDDSPGDTSKWAISATGYDAGGQVAWSQTPTQFAAVPDPADAAHGLARTSYGYDVVGRPVVVSRPDPAAPGAGVVVERRCFDPVGRQTASITPGSSGGVAVTRYGYNLAGWVVSVTNPLGIDYGAYDPQGAPCVVPVLDGVTGTVVYGYDLAGRRTARTTFDEGGGAVTETWAYDPAGRLVAHVDPLGRARLTRYRHDRGRVTHRIETSGSGIDRRWEISGLHANGVVDRVVWEHDVDGDDDPVGYDPVGAPDPDNQRLVLDYAYDAVGRVEAITDVTANRTVGFGTCQGF